MVNQELGKAATSEAEAFSPKWVYNMLNDGSPDSGTAFSWCYTFLAEHGDLRGSDFPYVGQKDNPANYRELPGENLETQMLDAMSMRLTSFANGKPYTTFSIPATGTPITSNTDSDLDNVKGFLSMKNMLTVGMTWDFKNMTILPDEENHESVICRVTTSPEADGHALAVVGYDDNLWVDLNHNGVCDPGEKGAFKLANSWSAEYGNDGFIWILYDTLNEVSAVTGWDSQEPATRQAAFSQGYYGGSLFYMIFPEEKDVSLVANLTYQSTSFNPDAFIDLSRMKANRTTNRSAYMHLPGNKKNVLCLLDFSDLCDPISSYMTGYEWGVTAPYNIQSVKLTDNKGNLLNSMWYDSKTGRHKTSLNLQLGDVSYDGKVNTADSTLVLQYVSGTIEFSNLQKRLADVDHDGKVTTADAVVIMNDNF